MGIFFEVVRWKKVNMGFFFEVIGWKKVNMGFFFTYLQVTCIHPPSFQIRFLQEGQVFTLTANQTP